MFLPDSPPTPTITSDGEWAHTAQRKQQCQTAPQRPLVKSASLNAVTATVAGSLSDEEPTSSIESTVYGDDLGELLIGFFRWFGRYFNSETMGIAVAPPLTMPALPNFLVMANPQSVDISSINAEPNETQAIRGCFFPLPNFSPTLVISDPFYPLMQNNIGKSVFAMWRIQAAFAEALQTLTVPTTPNAAKPTTMLARILQPTQSQQQQHQTTIQQASA